MFLILSFVTHLQQFYATCGLVYKEVKSNRLSLAERQRISIVRALLKSAPIVLLDEATASLDVENETKVQVGSPVCWQAKRCWSLLTECEPWREPATSWGWEMSMWPSRVRLRNRWNGEGYTAAWRSSRVRAPVGNWVNHLPPKRGCCSTFVLQQPHIFCMRKL